MLDRADRPGLRLKPNGEFNGPRLSHCYFCVMALVSTIDFKSQGHPVISTGPGQENCNGNDGAFPVANSISLYHHLPYQLSILHDWLGGMARCPRSPGPCDRAPCLSCA